MAAMLSVCREADLDSVSLLASFDLWLASPEARFLKGKFLWCNRDIDEPKAQVEDVAAGRKLNIDLCGWPLPNAS